MKNLTRKPHYGGFTLIELMIAIAIVAILVAMAVPAYKNFTIRAKVTECINGAAVAKVQISEYRQTLGPWPPGPEDAGLDGAGDSRFCDGFIDYTPATGDFTLSLDEGAIDPAVVGQIAPLMTPTQALSNIINWNCSAGKAPPGNLKFLPSTCRDS